MSDSIPLRVGDVAVGAKDPIAFTIFFFAFIVFSVIAPWVFVIGVGILTSLVIMSLGYSIILFLLFPKTMTRGVLNVIR
jgi:hypothetical protein